MKKIKLTAIFLLLLSIYSYGQKGYVQIGTIKSKGNSPDTIVRKKTELSLGKTFPNNYKRDETVVQTLRPYLVSDIVDPTNQSHPVYLQQVKEAREKLPEAKAEYLALMKASESNRKWMSKININNEADLNAITFVHIPVYYITPNIVFFKNGENIAKYYNLIRSGIKYLMLRNNKPIGYLNFNDRKSNFKSEYFPMHPPHDTESYNQVINLNKTPIGIVQNISTTDPNNKNTRIGGGVHIFGYVEQGHLVFSYYSLEGRSWEGANPNKAQFYKDYTLETAESFFSGNGNGSIINSWLETTVNGLKRRKP